MMVPAALVEQLISDILPQLDPSDILVDGGNSYYVDDMRRATELAAKEIHYGDCGTSGGIMGLVRGYCIMISGPSTAVKRLDPVLRTLAPGAGDIARTPGREKSGGTAEHGYLHCGPSGAGHFVKKVHNGIEFGLLASYAEGINILKHANVGKSERIADAETTPLRDPEAFQFDLDLGDIAEVWWRGSVIASWLRDLTATSLIKDPTLAAFGGSVSDSREGRWTTRRRSMKMCQLQCSARRYTRDSARAARRILPTVLRPRCDLSSADMSKSQPMCRAAKRESRVLSALANGGPS